MGSFTEPRLQRLSVATDYEDIESTLLQDGGLIIENFLSHDHISRMMGVLNKHYPPSHDFTYKTPGTFFPHETKVLWSLVGRDPSCGQEVCFHPLLIKLRSELLHMHIKRGNNAGTYDMQNPVADIPPRLSLSVAFDMRPGARQQPLHRDEDVWGTTHERPFDRKDIRQIGILIAGTKSVRENGATLVIPGSHKWDDERVPNENEAACAEMNPGDALIFLSSTRHAGGANRIQDPNDLLARRVMFSYFFARGYLRQEENMLVSIPRDVVLGMSRELQALIGYQASTSHCGFVEFVSPLDHELGLEGLFNRTGWEFLDPSTGKGQVETK
jgi:swainsonine biosynthesis dioxygenase SwnH1/2